MMSKDELIQKLGIEKLTTEAQDAQLQQLADTVRARLYNKISEQLSDEDLEVVSKLIDEGKDEEVDTFVTSKIPNYEQWSAEIEMNLINSMQTNRQAIEEVIDSRSSVKAPLE